MQLVIVQDPIFAAGSVAENQPFWRDQDLSKAFIGAMSENIADELASPNRSA